MIGDEFVDSVADLVELDGGVDENADIVDDKTNDLNGVFQTQGIPDKPQLVQIGEHEDGEIGRDRASCAVTACPFGFPMDAGLEFTKDIAVYALLAILFWRLIQRDVRLEG